MKKRIALGVIAALASGLLGAVAPASASVDGTPLKVVTSQSTSGGHTSTETATAIAGALNFVELSGSTVSDTVTVGSTLTLTGGTFLSSNIGTLNTAKTELTFTAASVDTATSIKIGTPTAGTITAVLKSYSQTGGVVTLTTTQTITVTVVEALTSTLYDNTKLSTVETHTGTALVDAAGAIFAPKGTVGSPSAMAKMTATQYANAAQTTETDDASSKAMSVAITGVGLISETSNATGLGTYLAWAAASNNVRTIYIYNDGRAGVATITWTSNGVALASQKVTFWGDVASYTLTNNNPHIVPSETGTITVVAKDANGVAVPGAAVYGASGTTAAATVDTATTSSAAATLGTATLTVTGVAAGTSTITVGNAASSPTVSATVAQKVTAATISTVDVAFDKATYAPGEKATITVTLKDANGDLFGDSGDGGSYAVFTAAATSNQSLQGSLPTASLVTASGTKTYTVYMPVVPGPVQVMLTTAAAAPLATAAQGKAITASANVVAPATAAETANAAAITALQTSLAALQTTVASLVASMTAQIKAINSALLKIAKKLKVKL